jgi:hypothetical protein
VCNNHITLYTVELRVISGNTLFELIVRSLFKFDLCTITGKELLGVYYLGQYNISLVAEIMGMWILILLCMLYILRINLSLIVYFFFPEADYFLKLYNYSQTLTCQYFLVVVHCKYTCVVYFRYYLLRLFYLQFLFKILQNCRLSQINFEIFMTLKCPF